RGLPVRIEEEELRIGPDVSRIRGDEDGRVADDADAALVGELLQGPPLAREQKLAELVPADGVRLFLASALQRLGLALDQRRRPFVPALALVRLLQRHEERVVIEPGRALTLEGLKSIAQTAGAARLKIAPGLSEKRALERNDRPII